ncbi:hypothetical protein ACQKQC_05905 [Vibrio fortis]
MSIHMLIAYNTLRKKDKLFELVENFKINKKDTSAIPVHIPTCELANKANSAYLIYFVDFTSTLSYSELHSLLGCIKVDTVDDFKSLPQHTIQLATSKGFFVSHLGVIKFLKAEVICAKYMREPRETKSIVSHNILTNTALISFIADHDLDTKEISSLLNDALRSNIDAHNEDLLLEHKSSLPIFMFKSIRNQMDFDATNIKEYSSSTNRNRARLNDNLLNNAKERITKGKSVQSCIAAYKSLIQFGYSLLPRDFDYTLEPSEKLLCDTLNQLNKVKGL